MRREIEALYGDSVTVRNPVLPSLYGTIALRVNEDDKRLSASVFLTVEQARTLISSLEHAIEEASGV